jgi:glutamate synthase domain-containing protein 1
MRREKDISGCGVIGIINEEENTFSGEGIVAGICNMMERGNGLGAGFAGYGIYPDFKDYWCFHMMYQDEVAKTSTEKYLNRYFKIKHYEPIPTNKVKALLNVPLLFRYFLELRDKMHQAKGKNEDCIVGYTMEINRHIQGAFVFFSGKNMGVFKGVGNPDEIAEFYRIPEYNEYTWTAHNRFPTNSPGWWGGAHPFGIVDWSVVHNGEISSYGINRRYLENFGYYCCFSTDTEVMAYLFDLLVRRHGLEYEIVGNILASPFWSQIERDEDEEKKAFLKALRTVYGPALVNGPFRVIVANSNYKAYKEFFPVVIVGGGAMDFLGEYMAGGLLVVLGLDCGEIVGDFVGAGMHGGTIFLRGEVDPASLGKEVKTGELTPGDMDLLRTHIGEFCNCFKLDLDEILKKPFTKIYPYSHRPYGTIYAY